MGPAEGEGASTPCPAPFFPKLEKYDTSLYLAGWGGGSTDAETMLAPSCAAVASKAWRGQLRWLGQQRGRRAGCQSTVETDPTKRQKLVKAALASFRDQVNIIPLHRQMIPWALRAGLQRAALAQQRAEHGLGYGQMSPSGAGYNARSPGMLACDLPQLLALPPTMPPHAAPSVLRGVPLSAPLAGQDWQCLPGIAASAFVPGVTP